MGTHTVIAPRKVIRLQTLLDRLDNIAYSTLNRWECAGKFPKRIVLGPNSVGWYEDEVDDWLANRPRQVDTDRRSPNPRARSSRDLTTP
jgi:prophage regulatory protein